METIELYMYLLIAVSFMIGFLISSILRSGAYHNKYKQMIYNYKNENEEITKNLDLSNQDLQNTQEQSILIKNKLSSQNTLLGEFEIKKRELEIDGKNFQTSKIALQNNIKSIDTKILDISNKLKTLTLEKDEILKHQNNLLKEEEKVAQKSIEIKDLKEHISNLEKEKKDLIVKIETRSNLNNEKEKEILDKKGKIKTIENEFKTKIDTIQKPLSESKQKALNYQYALEYVREKINSYESIEFDVIDKIISKNEEKGVFANLKQKLFSKSANYLKEGK